MNLSMPAEDSFPHAFIVHLWRGSVSDAQSGERLYFQSIEGLEKVIGQLAEKASVAGRNGCEREGNPPL
jgi:hypothetical protein